MFPHPRQPTPQMKIGIAIAIIPAGRAGLILGAVQPDGELHVVTTRGDTVKHVGAATIGGSGIDQIAATPFMEFHGHT